MEVLWGQMPATGLQALMTMLLEDLKAYGKGVLGLKAVRRFAMLGNWGSHHGNVWRDLQALLPTCNVPVHWMSCPFHHLQVGDFTRTLHHISFPWVTTHKQS